MKEFEKKIGPYSIWVQLWINKNYIIGDTYTDGKDTYFKNDKQISREEVPEEIRKQLDAFSEDCFEKGA